MTRQTYGFNLGGKTIWPTPMWFEKRQKLMTMMMMISKNSNKIKCSANVRKSVFKHSCLHRWERSLSYIIVIIIITLVEVIYNNRISEQFVKPSNSEIANFRWDRQRLQCWVHCDSSIITCLTRRSHRNVLMSIYIENWKPTYSKQTCRQCPRSKSRGVMLMEDYVSKVRRLYYEKL
jgi:hypothetical protein